MGKIKDIVTNIYYTFERRNNHDIHQVDQNYFKMK
jgi:hypothetical protein